MGEEDNIDTKVVSQQFALETLHGNHLEPSVPWPALFDQAIMFVNEQVQNGIFGDQSGQAGNRLSELLAIQGATGKAGWFEFRIDEKLGEWFNIMYNGLFNVV